MAPDSLASDSLVLALATDDSWLFVGTVTEVLDHARRHRGEGHAPDHGPRPGRRALDFYDTKGHVLRPLVDEGLDVHGFAGVGGPAAPDTVRLRIDRVLEAARAHLVAHPPDEHTAYSHGTEVPQVSGELPDVMHQLRDAEIPQDNAHKAGWFHNLLHALG